MEMEEVAVFVSAKRLTVRLTRIKRLSSRKNKKEIKSLIKDFILQYKDEKNWQGGYFETIKINPNGEPFSPIYVIKELEEFNTLLN